LSKFSIPSRRKKIHKFGGLLYEYLKTPLGTASVILLENFIFNRDSLRSNYRALLLRPGENPLDYSRSKEISELNLNQRAQA
jgi:hypothetical protein